MKAKKFAAVLTAAICAACALPLTACAPRSEVLKIYNAGDYIEESLIEEFESWYAEETGNRVVVKYDTFDTPENVLMRVGTQRADYDLVCPSDYIAERMMTDGLVQPIDKEIVYGDPEADDYIPPEELYYDGLLKLITFDADGDYFVPYIWGTFGIMYDVGEGKFEPGDPRMESWSALWSDEWQKETGRKRVLMKDSVRDAYSMALIYSNRDKLSELSDGFTDYTNGRYGPELESYFSDISDDTIAKAQQALIEQKKCVCKYEVDDGKNDMLAGTTDAWLGFFWSCDAELIMWEDAGDHFYYTVPKEGSNLWVDGWLIPKYAANTTAANYFLRFINTHEYAKINFDYLGNNSAIRSVMEEAKEELEEDEDGFFEDRYDGFKEMFLEMLFPSPETLSRCAVMHDFGVKRGTDLDSMWIDVKTTW